MNREKILAASVAAASFAIGCGGIEEVHAGGRYVAEFRNADGDLVWSDTIENLVTTAGKNFLLDTLLSGSAYTAAWYLGLVDGASAPTFDVANTAASHAGWTENTGYSNATRPAPSFNAASGGSKASNSVSFTINANGTIAGCFLISNATKGGTTGTLYSCGAFTGGNQPVTNGGTLTVTYTASA